MKLRPAYGLLPAATLTLLLAACGDEPAPAVEEGEREASQEVLEGTISDDMIPLDELRSTAPLAEPEADEDGGDSSDAESAAAEEAADESD